jgi:folylpolyglutamate synthase
MQCSDFNAFNAVHIAGTKGKGSTSAFVESILRHYHASQSPNGGFPFKTGLYTSPHLLEVRERIRINGQPLSQLDFAHYFFECWDKLTATCAGSGTTMPTYFRFLTLMAFHVFLREKVDAAVVEVGIGGAYDATNILEKPAVCGVSSLGFDHQAILGETLPEIAWHKCGIFKVHTQISFI